MDDEEWIDDGMDDKEWIGGGMEDKEEWSSY